MHLDSHTPLERSQHTTPGIHTQWGSSVAAPFDHFGESSLLCLLLGWLGRLSLGGRLLLGARLGRCLALGRPLGCSLGRRRLRFLALLPLGGRRLARLDPERLAMLSTAGGFSHASQFCNLYLSWQPCQAADTHPALRGRRSIILTGNVIDLYRNPNVGD